MRLVYLSPVPWKSFKQRPHKFVEWYHDRSGADVLWVEPYPGRLLVKGDFRRLVKDSDNRKDYASTIPTPAWLRVVRPTALPVEPVPVIHWINRLLWSNVIREVDAFIEAQECTLAIGKPSDMAVQVLARHAAVYSLYDAMDDFQAFHKGMSKTAMRMRDRLISSRVNRIFVSSSRLAEHYAPHKSKLSVVLNACSVDELPAVQTERQKPKRPVLGYVGTISHWFDWDMVIALADTNPDADVQLIGPNLAPASGQLPANITLLPACKHEDAIQAMQGFSVALIPFKRSVLTESVDPIKYYEYRALGLPVITASFGQMSLRSSEEGVFFLDKDADYSAVVDAALKFRYAPEAIQIFRDANSWDKRFDSSGLSL